MPLKSKLMSMYLPKRDELSFLLGPSMSFYPDFILILLGLGLKAYVSEEILNWHCLSVMPYPCSHFYFDIKFGDRLYSKENRSGSPLLF